MVSSTRRGRHAARRGAAASSTSSTPVSAPSDAAATAAGRPAPSGFRPELHGLRGLAVLLVMLYHVFSDRVSGGVDVFLFVSAFFLTGSFVRRIEQGRRLAPLAYWGTVFKRLLAPAVVVILGTLAAVRLWLPPSTWMPTIDDALGSLLQVQNWVLIHRGTDYEAAASLATSPLQHFWSLSIQGQVFLLWPILLAGCALLVRRTSWRPRAVVGAALALLGGASLIWSVVSTAADQPVAYFDTAARLWEFAAGSLLALAPVMTGRRRLRVALGWAGIAVLIGTGALIDAQSMFPGWIAAVPLLGAVLVFVAGDTSSALGADRLLRSRPLSFLGDISYALYLVHWPALTVWLLASGREELGLLRGLVLVAGSILAAYLLTRLVDTPVRRWRWANASPLRTGGVVALVLVVGLAPSIGAKELLERSAAQAQDRAVADNPGGRVLEDDYLPHPDADPDAPPLPTGATLRQDWAHLDGPCEGADAPEDPALRDGCMATDAPEGSKVMVAVGNSRLAQNAMAFAEPAAEHGWKLILLRQNSCPFTPEQDSYTGEECDRFNDAALEYLLRSQPDAVVLSTTLLPHEGAERPSPALEQTVPQLLEAGLPVVALRETPRLQEDPVTCVEENTDVEDCTQALDQEAMPQRRADADRLEELSSLGSLHPVDLLDGVCPAQECPAIIGNVYVMFDVDHPTRTYMLSLGQMTDRLLGASGFRW